MLVEREGERERERPYLSHMRYSLKDKWTGKSRRDPTGDPSTSVVTGTPAPL